MRTFLEEPGHSGCSRQPCALQPGAAQLQPPQAGAPSSPTLLSLQHKAGNRAVGRLVHAGAIQAKLRVGQPHDRYEQEADRVAGQVMRMMPPQVQPKRCACGGIVGPDGECAACRARRLRGASPPQLQPAPRGGSPAGVAPVVPPSVEAVLRTGGRPLEPATRAFLEPRFGHDFSQVRVHTDGPAAASAEAIDARAYTAGRHIVFGPAQYAPHTQEGRQLVAHELAHVLQQSPTSAPEVVQRQAGGGAPAAPAAGAAPRAPPMSVKYNGCTQAPYTQAVVEAAALAAYNQVVTTNCIRSQRLKDEILSEFANLTVDCEQGSAGSPCGMAWRFLSHTVNIYPKALPGGSCGPLESTILHEVVHLTELRLIEHGDLADACEASCFGYGSGDPTKCSEETLVRHGPRFHLGMRSGPGGTSPLGRVGYEVIRSWTGTAFSLGLRLDVPLTDRESFVRAGLEVGGNFQLLGSLYGRLFGGFTVPLPPGGARPSTLVGAGLGFDFGRTQLELLYDVLDLQSRDDRTHQLMLGIGFRFGK
jgi:hypothetical protein